ncbi:MAG TPA: SRPBCC domain-containing protein [Candidatus Aquilonibacter sp.]|nr:SRPBCC domain-containing protein [Candidatus Aquilonibacter sp.]
MASTASLAQNVSNLTLNLEEEIHVNAPLQVTFESLLEQLGPEGTRPDGTSMQMKIEPWPGGRWYRDLGDKDGHFWAHVQAIKRPTLLEFCGPLFMSYPVISNVQYRLSEVPGGTLIKFHHSALGFVPDDVRSGMSNGWKHMHQSAKARAERKRP